MINKYFLFFTSLIIILGVGFVSAEDFGYNLLEQPTFNNDTAFVNLSGSAFTWITTSLGNLTDVNDTQMENNGGTLSIIPEWLTSFISSVVGVVGNIFDQSLNTTDNVTFDNIDSSGNISVDGNVSATFFIGDGSLLTGISGSGGNPFDQSLNTTDNVTFDNIDSSGNINVTNNITAGYIFENGYQLNTLYYAITNPFGFFNSTNPQTETDPLAYNGTLMYADNWNATNYSYYLKTNPFVFWNDTFATFNETHADTIYEPKSSAGNMVMKFTNGKFYMKVS